MMLYKLALVLMIFGASSAAIQDIGIYPIEVPQTDAVGIREADVRALSNNTAGTPAGAFSGWVVLMMILHVLLTAFMALVTIIPILLEYGVPIEFAVLIQTPIWLVFAWGLYQMHTGHATQGMD